MRHLLLGGQKSGKSAQAERLAQHWLAINTHKRVVYIVTAQGFDEEMQSRIARHQADRALRLINSFERVLTVEVPHDLAGAIDQHSESNNLIVIDCITLWLTNYLMPFEPLSKNIVSYEQAQLDFLSTLNSSQGPVVIVSNEIGLGVIPMGPSVRSYVDTLGMLNQALAKVCHQVTLMTAGLSLSLKDER